MQTRIVSFLRLLAKFAIVGRLLFCLVGFFLFLSPIAFATVDNENNEQLLQDVFRTELVYPEEKGNLEFSFAPTFLKQIDQKNLIFPLELEYGLTNAWTINFFGETFVTHYPNQGPRTTGAGDIGLGTKYSFMHIHHTNDSVALNFEMSFPTGNIDKGLTNGFQIYAPSVSLARDFPNFHHSQIFSQLGFEFLNRTKTLRYEEDMTDEPTTQEALAETKPQAHVFFFNIGYFYPVGIARYVAEMNWQTNRWNHRGKENIVYLTPGIVWDPTKSWEFAVGSSVGLTKQSDPYDIFLRATVEFNT